jgi:sulfur carrier protein ThiS
VRLHGHLHVYVEQKSREFELELPTRTTVAEVIRTLKIPDAEISVVILNGESKPQSTTLSNGDSVRDDGFQRHSLWLTEIMLPKYLSRLFGRAGGGPAQN